MSENGKLLVGLLATVVFPAAAEYDYCNRTLVPCYKEGDHTMCVYKDDTPASACIELWSKPITESYKEEILHTHNMKREYVAAGKETRSIGAPMPQAGNMGVMTWDDEIARIAQRWALRCEFGHDECRNIYRLSSGQNIALVGHSSKSPPNMTNLVVMWYEDEIGLFNPNNIDPFVMEHDSGHLSQYLWANSYKVGCGYTSYLAENLWKNYLVCNYGPSGNYLAFPMYKIGAPCSACPNGTTCGGDSRYPSLCQSDNGEVPPTVGPGVGDMMTWGAAPRVISTWSHLLLAVAAARLILL